MILGNLAVPDVVVDGGAECRREALARAHWFENASRVRVAQPVCRRAAGIERRHVRRRAAEAGHGAAIGIRRQERQPIAASHDGRIVHLEREAGTRPEVVQVRRVDRAVGEREAAAQIGWKARRGARRADQRDAVVVEPGVDLIVALAGRHLVVPAQPEVHGQPARQPPVVLEVSGEIRVPPVEGILAHDPAVGAGRQGHVAEQERGEGIAAVSGGRVRDGRPQRREAAREVEGANIGAAVRVLDQAPRRAVLHAGLQLVPATDVRHLSLDVVVVRDAVLTTALADRCAAVVGHGDRHEAIRDARHERRRVAQRRRIEASDIFSRRVVEAAMPRPSGAQRRDGRLRQRRGQVDAEHVVPAMVIAAGPCLRLAALHRRGFRGVRCGRSVRRDGGWRSGCDRSAGSPTCRYRTGNSRPGRSCCRPRQAASSPPACSSRC